MMAQFKRNDSLESQPETGLHLWILKEVSKVNLKNQKKTCVTATMAKAIDSFKDDGDNLFIKTFLIKELMENTKRLGMTIDYMNPDNVYAFIRSQSRLVGERFALGPSYEKMANKILSNMSVYTLQDRLKYWAAVHYLAAMQLHKHRVELYRMLCEAPDVIP